MTDQYETRPIVARTIPDGENPDTFGAQCALRHHHAPQPRYLEEHHVVPRAWQHYFAPDPSHFDGGGPFHAPDRDGLWCTERVALCRTGHGNVHYWIERAMKLYASVPSGPDHSERAMTAARDGQLHIGHEETVIARQALVLFSDAGGDLVKLTEAGLWGGLYGGNDAPVAE